MSALLWGLTDEMTDRFPLSRKRCKMPPTEATRTSMKAKVHPDDRMTSRERLLAAYRGEEVDRMPYWAKVANNTWRLSQPEAIRKLDDEQLQDYIGADGIFGMSNCVRTSRTRVETRDTFSDHTRVTTTRTPHGDLTERWQQDPTTGSWHPVEFPVKGREDLKRFRWVYTDVAYEADADAVGKAAARQEEIGRRGITKTGCGTSPLMHLVEHVIGPVNTHLMLADHPAEMDELIALMHAARLGLVERVAAATPADLVVSVENTSTSLISPGQFEKYCLGHLIDYGRIIEGAGKMHELHMCGLLNALLDRIDTIPAASVEAYTAPTLADTRLVEGRTRAPSKCLVGGTNCMTWLKGVDQIEQYIAAELDACPDHRRIVLTTAGVAPPACPADTFRAVGEWIRTLPVRM